jgi:hypothetical protein
LTIHGGLKIEKLNPILFFFLEPISQALHYFERDESIKIMSVQLLTSTVNLLHSAEHAYVTHELMEGTEAIEY